MKKPDNQRPPWRKAPPVKKVEGPAEKQAPQREMAENGIRINRYIAQSGICARRKADELIAEGQVKVNGEIVGEPGMRIKPGDRVEVGDKVLAPTGLLYILMNKPEDTITTRSDEKGRRTVLDLINMPDEEKSSLFPVGRLDRNTSGVLLLTNDGELAYRLMHPRFEVQKVYHVRVTRPVVQADLDALLKGVDLDDGPARADHVEYMEGGQKKDLILLLHEGKNRQVRRMLEALGYEVEALERSSYAGLTSKGVRRGKWRRLETYEVRRLKNLVHMR